MYLWQINQFNHKMSMGEDGLEGAINMWLYISDNISRAQDTVQYFVSIDCIQNIDSVGLIVCKWNFLIFLLFFGAYVVIQRVDYVFAENGLVAYKDGQLLSVQVRK